jgi:hypothetical protein
MYKYAGIYEGEFCSFYYCDTCGDLRELLEWDWSEGIQNAEEALADCGVIGTAKCPYYENATKRMEELESEYYKKCAKDGEEEVPVLMLWDCGGKLKENCRDWGVDFPNRKIYFECDCMDGGRRLWSIDLMETAKAVAGKA